MASDLFVLSCGGIPDSSLVMGFRGTEAIGKPYRFDVYVSVHRGLGAGVELGDVVGSRAKLMVRQPNLLDPRPPFLFAGIVSQAELVNEFDERAVFRVTIVPEIWRLGLALHSRIFTKKTIPEILSEVLTENGVESFELRLTGSYPTEEHVCQYKESDLAFLSRWMEHEGMYYFFEHGDDGETLVITDDKSSHTRLVPGQAVRYHPASEDELAGEALHRVSSRYSALPAIVKVTDYDYAKPALELAGTAQVSPQGLAEYNLYGDRSFTPDQVKQQAALRAEAFKAGQEVLSARGTARYLRTGYLFELEDHPRGQLNIEYLVTELTHLGRQDVGVSELDALITDKSPEIYRVALSGIPAATQFRSERATPWPRIHCFENAVVDGPATSEYAQIDEQGRYAVKFKFDEGPNKDGKASTWVRMAQPHGGSVEGFHFPLRKKTEVLISFLGGDPDRPVIASVLPNASTPSPVTSSNNTKNVIQTGGASRIEIEDQAGGQYMKQFTPVANTMMWMGFDGTSPQGHNVELSTDGSGLESFGTYFDRFIGGTKNEHVVGDVSRNYDSNYLTTVLGNVVQTYVGNQSTTVTGSVDRTINGTLTETVVGAVSQTYLDTATQTVVGDVSQAFLAKHTLDVTGDQTTKVGGSTTHTYEAGLTVTVNGATSTHTANVGYELEVKPDATMHATNKFDMRGDATARLSSDATNVNGDTSVSVSAGSKITISSSEITVNGTTLVKLSGPSVIEIVGGDVTVSGGNIAIAAASSLVQAAGAAFEMKAGAGATIVGGPLVDVHAGIIKLNS
ncbi:MAG: type VI secretion system tip protein VgrG [Myxococcales bacterium]|nr:type VI secretion system tip protein VgrG [Myxococcales bacterium]